MQIHNFYADILLSVRTLFDTYIFNPRFIRHFEFNIGNRTFQLDSDYKTNYEFPTVMVSLNDTSNFLERKTSVSQNVAFPNIDQIRVLYNKDTGQNIFVQEESTNIPVSISINCESQLQAKEIEAQIKRFLILNKQIQFLEFTSFLEIDKEILDAKKFNPNLQEITNLFTKKSKRTGSLDYCFSIRYKPFLKLDSISSAIPDSTMRSFQVALDLTYMIQYPLNLISESDIKTIDRITLNFSYGYEPISTQPIQSINSTDESGSIKLSYIISDTDNAEDISSLISELVIPDEKVFAENEWISALRNSDDSFTVTIKNTPVFKIKNEDAVIKLPNNEYMNLTVIRDLVFKKTTLRLNEQLIQLCVQLNKNELTFQSTYRYDFYNRVGEKLTGYPFVLDDQSNKICFKFKMTEWLNKLLPSLTNPLFLQIIDINIKPPGETTNEIIGHIKLIGLSSDSASITWSTTTASHAKLEYGTDLSYGKIVESDGPVGYHRVNIFGLSSNTTYHFRVIAKNKNNEEVKSNDYNFTTN